MVWVTRMHRGILAPGRRMNRLNFVPPWEPGALPTAILSRLLVVCFASSAPESGYWSETFPTRHIRGL